MTTTELSPAGGPPAAPSPLAAPPPGQAVPRLIGTGAESDLSETLVTDRGLLQTLLSVDGRRTIAEIGAGRGPDAVTHLQALATQGLISIDVPAPAAPAAPRPLRRRRPGPQTARTAPLPARSIAPSWGSGTTRPRTTPGRRSCTAASPPARPRR